MLLRSAESNSNLSVEDGTKLSSSNSKQMSPRLLGVFSALFYCIVSIALISCNKLVLTYHKFPGSLALAASQFVATCASTLVLNALGVAQLAESSRATLAASLPLTFLYLADVNMGLIATGALSLPMFTVLRRASIPMTMALERFVGQSQPTTAVVISVWGMLFGAGLAAYDDLHFDSTSYLVVLANDALTAARGVYVKSALSTKRLDKLSLLFYNALVSLVVVCPILVYQRSLEPITQWLLTASLEARAAWLASAGLGPVLQYAIFLCTQHNSALTTTVVGALKNILTTYVGMFLGDYAYSTLNFFGISLSCAASFLYSYAVVIKGGQYASFPPQPKLLPLAGTTGEHVMRNADDCTSSSAGGSQPLNSTGALPPSLPSGTY